MLHSPSLSYLWPTEEKTKKAPVKKIDTKRCSFSGELTTWSCSPLNEQAAVLKHELEISPPLWYAVCTLLFCCSLSLTRTGHPEIPSISTAASSSGLHTGQAAWREYATFLPSLLCMRASSRALGMCCNLVECQIALLNWAFLKLSLVVTAQSVMRHLHPRVGMSEGNMLFFY